MVSRAEQRELRRQEIIAVGLDLFVRKGYAATRIQDIAEEAGMSTGLLFHYFESKEKLYEELIQLGISGPQSVMPPAGIEPITYFETVAAGILCLLSTSIHTAKLFVLMNHALQSEVMPPAVQGLFKQLDTITPSISLIQAGQENKTIRDGDPYALSVAFWSAINGIAEFMALVPDAPCPKPEWLVDIIRRRPE